MAIGKRGKKLGIQLRDENGRTYWAKDGNGQAFMFPDTKEGREDASIVEDELKLERKKRNRRPGLMRSGEITVADYFERWTKVHRRPKDSTNIQYHQALTPFVKRYGDRQMK